MITERKKEELEQIVKDNSNRENTLTKKPTETELSQKDKKHIAIVLNSVPIGYIVCIVLGIGSMWMQISVYLLALCLSCLIGRVMPVRTFYNIGKISLLISVAYIIVRIFIAGISGICGL